MELLKKPLGKGKQKKNANIQLKTYINFAERTQKKEAGWIMAIPGVAIVLVLAALIAKVAVVDRFDEMYWMQDEAKRLQENLDADIAIISSANELNYQFYHHTWTDMTDLEKTRVSRTDIFKIVEDINKGKVTVQNYSVKDNTITMAVTTDNLDTISKLSSELMARGDVESVNVSSAQKTSVTDDNENSKTILEAQLKINLKGLNAGE